MGGAQIPKKPSTGTMQRRLRYASQNVGGVRTASRLASIGVQPPLVSWQQYGVASIFLFLPLFGKKLDYSLAVWFLGHTV